MTNELVEARQHGSRIRFDNGTLWIRAGELAHRGHRVPQGEDHELDATLRRSLQQ